MHSRRGDGRERSQEFARAVRTAIVGSGLTLRELSRRLEAYGPSAVSVSSLSQWQSGHSLPPLSHAGLRRVAALERALEQPAGSLTLLLRPTTRRDERAAVEIIGKTATAGGPHGDALRDLIARVSRAPVTLPVSVSEHFVVAGRGLVSRTVTQTVRAVDDLVDCYWLMHVDEHDPRTHVQSLAGCRIGRVLRTGTAGTGSSTAVELLFGALLRRGESHTFSFRVAHASEAADAPSEAVHVQTEPLEALHLRIHFEGQAAGLRVTEVGAAAGLRPLPADARTATLELRNPVPGRYGWRWSARETAA